MHSFCCVQLFGCTSRRWQLTKVKLVSRPPPSASADIESIHSKQSSTEVYLFPWGLIAAPNPATSHQAGFCTWLSWLDLSGLVFGMWQNLRGVPPLFCGVTPQSFCHGFANYRRISTPLDSPGCFFIMACQNQSQFGEPSRRLGFD